MNLINKALTLLVAAGSMVSAQAMSNCTPSNQATLTVGIDLSAGLIPYSSSSMTGADVSVACELRERLGANTLNIVNIPYNQMPAALAAGTIQLAIGLSAQTQATNPAPAVSYVVYNNDNLGIITTNVTLQAIASALGIPVAQITPQTILSYIAVAGGLVGVIGDTTSGTPPDRRESAILASLTPTHIVSASYSNLGAAITALTSVPTAIDAIFVNTATANAAVAQNSALVSFPNVTITPTPSGNLFSAGLAIGVSNAATAASSMQTLHKLLLIWPAMEHLLLLIRNLKLMVHHHLFQH